MITALFRPSRDSILRIRDEDGIKPQWFPWLMLVWSMWIFITPLYSQPRFPHWLLPTLASYAVFLLLFWRAYYRDRRQLLWAAMAIAGLAFVLTPFNPGAQGYVIYACAFLGFHTPLRSALLWMIALQVAYLIEWLILDWPLLYMFTAVIVGFAVGLMNASIARKMQADAVLSLSHDEVRRLAGLAERERISRDLHDLLGHTLSLVALKSDLAGKLVHRDPDAAAREITEVSRVARDALAQVRTAVTGIRAAGMAAELASAKLLLECDGISLVCEVDEHSLADAGRHHRALPTRVENALAMTVREAVTNIQRHAHARQAQIGFEVRGDEAILRIADDGRGAAIVPGNGLDGMRARIEALGGRLRIDSQKGNGTRIEVHVPLMANDDAAVTETQA